MIPPRSPLEKIIETHGLLVKFVFPLLSLCVCPLVYRDDETLTCVMQPKGQVEERDTWPPVLLGSYNHPLKRCTPRIEIYIHPIFPSFYDRLQL